MASYAVGGTEISGDDNTSRWQKIDFGLLLATFLLVAVGLVALFSVNGGETGGRFSRQVLNLIVGGVPFALCAFLNPALWRKWANGLYVLNVMLLLAVLFAGTTVKGATRWIEVGPLQFQPSEMAKLSLILTLSAFYAARRDQVHRLSTFVLSFVHLSVPLVLVFLQPHLGASLVLVFIWLAVSMYAGVPFRFIGGSVALVALALGFALVTPGVLKDYQVTRVKALFVSDEQGHDYQAAQAEIAYGLGGVTGTGYLKGLQKRNGYIPEQDTDFIFSVIGEEGGLIGCALVLGLYALFFYRVWWIGFLTLDPFFKMVVGGILAMIGFHTLVNLAMNLQLGPVVGLWLPFLSYGGTALWLCLAAVGLLLAIRARERPILF